MTFLMPGTRVVVIHDGGAKVPALGTITRTQVWPTDTYDIDLDDNKTRLLSHPPSSVVALTKRQVQLVEILRASGGSAKLSSKWMVTADQLADLGVVEVAERDVRLKP